MALNLKYLASSVCNSRDCSKLLYTLHCKVWPNWHWWTGHPSGSIHQSRPYCRSDEQTDGRTNERTTWMAPLAWVKPTSRCHLDLWNVDAKKPKWIDGGLRWHRSFISRFFYNSRFRYLGPNSDWEDEELEASSTVAKKKQDWKTFSPIRELTGLDSNF